MLKVYEQETYEGCLPICLMILADIEATKNKELEIIYKAVKSRKESYTLIMLTTFVEIYNISSTLYVDNILYTKYLKTVNKNKNINVIHQEITWNFVKNLNEPFTIYVDDFILGAETHSQHFIVTEVIKNNLIEIIDPWTGERKEITKDILMKAVRSLKNRFFYSPVLITLNKI